MTISFIVECLDCSENYRIRYGMGNNYPQSASFQCSKCSKQITVGFKIRDQRILEGATLNNRNEHDEDVTVINLHPEIPTDIARQNDPSFFQTVDVFLNLAKSKADIPEFKQSQYIWSKFYSDWVEIEPSLRVVSTKDKKVLKQLMNIEFDHLADKFHDWLTVYLDSKVDTKFDKINDELSTLNYLGIKKYIKKEDQYLKKIYSLCNTYMKHSNQFQSTILYQKYDWELTPNMIANVNWDDISSVYGDLYEIVGDFFTIPTMINNVRQNRKFDKFKSPNFTLSKYLKTDKAGRGNNFVTNLNLKPLTDYYFSWLRNGTHHKNSYYNSVTHEISLGTGKGGGNEKKISIIEYIRACNELFEVGVVLSSLILHFKK